MNRRVALDRLLQSITFQPEEAVAIVQQLIFTRPNGELTPPLGPPSTATVFVGADGSVTCAACDATFAVSDLAALLDAMLPPGGTVPVGVPGGLRYTIARARMEVDAPPFDSVEEFSRSLARHERGERTTVIQRLIARVNSQGAESALDRRRADPAVAQLRRQLRDADARVYDQQRAIDTLSVMTAQPHSSKRSVAVFAGIMIGLTFAGVGELMHSRPESASQSATTELAAPAAPALPDENAAVAAPAKPVAETEPAEAKAEDRRPEAKKVSRSSVKSRDREPARPRRFEWLRTRFVFRSDPL
jgi:hypothetical protein